MSDGTKKIIMSVIALALLISAVYAITGFFGEDEIVAKANMRTLMDLETGELFEFTVDENWAPYPHKNPKTGTDTLFPIEWCFARECGPAGGTPVILNVWRGKKDEPTYCPKCGSLVRFHNPRPRNADPDSPPGG